MYCDRTFVLMSTKGSVPGSPSDLNTGKGTEAQQAAQAGADHCALFSISCVTSTLASVYYANSQFDVNKMFDTFLPLH